MKAVAIVVLAALLCFANASNWAVLVAGSNGFWNYRHQTDICHSYQILIKGGIPADHIIVLSYNDVAKDGSNPYPGKLFNKPDPSGPGKDVNAGCKIDYEGADVTPETFIKVLKGDSKGLEGVGNGRVLGSNANDHVFIYFSDHGASGLIAFPNEYLYVDDLISTLKYMTDNKKYKELTFYLEACESGSMFVDLPTNTKIYATSASNPYESSWAYYCGPDDVINGQSIGSCLGDEYSIRWMEDSDAANFQTETLQQQFLNTQKLTIQSHVLQWGDLSFTGETLNVFQGGSGNEKKTEKLNLRVMDKDYEVTVGGSASTIDSRDVKLIYAMRKHDRENTLESEMFLKEELDSRDYFNQKFWTLMETVGIKAEDTYSLARITQYDCLKASINQFESQCAKLSDYALKYVRVLGQICENGTPSEIIQSAIQTVCA